MTDARQVLRHRAVRLYLVSTALAAVGLNIFVPEGMPLAGTRLSVEFMRVASQYYDGAQLGADWGIVLGWQTMF